MRVRHMMDRVFVRAGVLAMAAGLALGAEAHGQARYRVVDLGPVGGSGFADGFGLNDQGQTVGRSTASNPEGFHATLWLDAPAYGKPAGANSLGTISGPRSAGYGINDSGFVCGFSTVERPGEFPNLLTRAFLWSPLTDEMQDLGTLGGNDSIAEAINGSGAVVGEAETDVLLPDSTIFYQKHAFLWTADTGMIDLGTFGGLRSGAEDINELGQVAGVSWYNNDPDPYNSSIRAFLWLPEPAYGLPAGLNDIDDLSDGHYDSSTAHGINDLGQVVGYHLEQNIGEPGVAQAFIWLPEPAYELPAGLTRLGSAGGPARNSVAFAINNHGQIVGRSEIPSDDPFTQQQAALWENGEIIILDDVSIGDEPWSLTSATDINDAGQISGFGVSPQGYRAFRLDPIVDCPADFDGDGEATVADFTAFRAAYLAGDMNADYSGNGSLDVADFTAFRTAYLAGCD